MLGCCNLFGRCCCERGGERKCDDKCEFDHCFRPCCEIKREHFVKETRITTNWHREHDECCCRDKCCDKGCCHDRCHDRCHDKDCEKDFGKGFDNGCKDKICDKDCK